MHKELWNKRIMDSLCHRLGLPPYRLDQFIALLDEASSLTSNSEETSIEFQDNAVQIAESMETLAWLVEFNLHVVFPHSNVSSIDSDIVYSIAPKALQLKNWLFNRFQHAPGKPSSKTSSAQLCQYCSWSFQRLGIEPTEHPAELTTSIRTRRSHYLHAIDHWPDVPVLEERSLHGCEFCPVLREQLVHVIARQPKNARRDSQDIFVWINFCWSEDARFLEFVTISLGGGWFSEDCLHFTVHTEHDNVAEELGISRPPAMTSLDHINLEFIEDQLASTNKNLACNTYRPRRLLDVGLGAQSESKIIDGQQAVVGPDGLRYAALSYCWGPVEQSRKQLKLTMDTQNLLYGSISWSLMTPVLRDAITLCRVLGLRYLWIDSLCILQDGNSTDWEEQSQEMSHIFGNSWLTICAPASESCLEGFLDHIDRHSCSIEIGCMPKDTLQVRGSVVLRLFTLNGKPGSTNDYGDDGRLAPLLRDLQSSRWNKRGWVFQERILSPRLLYFGARMIHFQHGHNVASEDGSCVDGDFFGQHDSMIGLRHYATNLLHQLEAVQNQGPYITDFWYSLVPAFSTSNFTDRKDTFPAIAGVARRVHEFSNHRYLAGLWEEDLCCGLLWTTDERGFDSKSRRPPASLRQVLQTIKKSAISIAPSWSWASRGFRPAFLITNKINTTCRVRLHLRAEYGLPESRVIVDGVNPYGRIRTASISLFGSTLRLSPGSLASMRWVGFRDQLCELLPDLFALIQPDWNPRSNYGSGATGIKKYMRAHLQLLLIASCCSDWSKSNNTRAAHSQPPQNNAESGPELEANRRHSNESSISSITEEQADEIYLESMKPKYRNSFYDDGHAGFDAAIHCDLCSDHTLRRDVWGLLIYPAGPPDSFYRVGTFMSRAQHGGSALFEGAERRRIELV